MASNPVSNVSHAARLVHSGPQPLPHAQCCLVLSASLNRSLSGWPASGAVRLVMSHIKQVTANVSSHHSVQQRSYCRAPPWIIPSPVICPSPDLAMICPNRSKVPVSARLRGRLDWRVAGKKAPTGKAGVGVKRCYPLASSLPVPCVCGAAPGRSAPTFPPLSTFDASVCLSPVLCKSVSPFPHVHMPTLE